MYIAKLLIKNFRTFRETEIEFQEGVNVLIGHNNAGKTNVLRALGLVFDNDSAKRLTVDDFNRDGNVLAFFETDAETGKLKMEPPTITVAAIIKESTGDYRYNEQLPDDNNTVFDWRIRTEAPYEAKLTYEFFLPEGEDRREYETAMGRLISEKRATVTEFWSLLKRRFVNKYVARIFGGDENLRKRAETNVLSRFDFQFVDAVRDVEKHLFTGRDTILRDVLDYFLDDDIKADAQLTEEEKARKREDRARLFQDCSGTLISGVKARVNADPILDYSAAVGASIGGEPAFEGETTESHFLSTLRLMVKNSLGIALPASHNGLGYNNLIFVSVLLSKMQMSASNYVSEDDKKVFPMLVIEEPEAHLHPSMQFKFLKFLKQNLKDNKQVRQVFVTTHSTHITAAVDLDEIICLNVGDDNSLQVAYPGRVFNQADKKGMKSKAYVQRFLDATKSDMLFAKRVILVEGIAEQLLMSCLAEIENMSFEDKHISVINVGGRYFEHFLRLFDYDPMDATKKNAINKRVACITDADPSKRRKTDGAKFGSCYPHELGVDDGYDYRHLCSTVEELNDSYTNHPNIRICARTDGKGKTLEFDLAFQNPTCKTLLTEYLAKKDELTSLIEAYGEGKALGDMMAISSNTEINASIQASHWPEDDKKKALIAARYLRSIENSQDGGKGIHALQLEYNLKMEFRKGDFKFSIPSHIREAIQFVCR
jgi:predicted ATP-dependent endonuclease of OLD family